MLVSQIQPALHCTKLGIFLVYVCEDKGITVCSALLPVSMKEAFPPYTSCLFLMFRGFPSQFFKNLSTS